MRPRTSTPLTYTITSEINQGGQSLQGGTVIGTLGGEERCYSAFELLLGGTWSSACYQRVDVFSQLLDIYSAFELLLGTWPSAYYQCVDVLSQLLDSPLHVGLSSCYFAFELLLGTWPSVCNQRVDVLSQLLDIYSAFELLLGTWPSACYQRVDVLSQLLDSPLHVGLSSCYFAFELLLVTWPSACYQRVDVLSQPLDIYSAFELLLGTWPSACYQRVDVLSQLLDSPLHVGLSCCYSAFELLLGTWPSACWYSPLHLGFRYYYQSSPTRRARTENKKNNDHSRSSVNTREVSEGSMGVDGTLGPALLVSMARCKTRKAFTSTRGRTGEYSSPATHVRVNALGATFV